MNLKTAFQDNDRAVSPVIGVILMVAITVILAAVVGTFVLGLGDQIGGSATAGVTVDGDNTTDVTVTLTNLGTAESVKIVDSNGTSINTGDTGVTKNLPMNSTGASVTLDDTTTPVGTVTISWRSGRVENSRFSVRSKSQAHKQLIFRSAAPASGPPKSRYFS